MSRPLSKSPARAAAAKRTESASSAGLAASQVETARFEILATAAWPGFELVCCRENISRLTHWKIHRSCHTVIVHIGGPMLILETEIEGFGSRHAPAAAGDIWLVPGGHRYASQACGGQIRYVELRIAPEADVAMSNERSAPLGFLRPRMAHHDAFLHSAILQLMRSALAADDLSVMMGDRIQLLLRQHLFRDYRDAMDAPAEVRFPRRLAAAAERRVSQFIADHLDQRITLAQLAGVAGLSVHQLLIAFRATFGTTPAQHILENRLQRARWLLEHSRDDLASIAMATGFSNHSHFSAAFRQRTCITPSQFRNQHQASARSL